MNRMFMDFATATDGIYVAKQITMEGLRTSAGMDAVQADVEMNRMFMYSAAAMEGLYVAKQMTMEGNAS